MSGSSVELRGVTKAFGARTVLDHLDLHLDGGELVTLLGPSGCGKTTALRAVAGFERPDAGSVLLDGVDVTARRPSARGVGVVFQAYSLFPHLTALDNVAYGLRVQRVPRRRRRERAMELLEVLQLAGHGGHYPWQLSGGQQQRVALARALAIEPRVLLLDEPLSALDARVRVQLREEIRRVQTATGTTTLLVTHDQEEALTMGDRVAVMRAGRIEQLGPPEEVYRQPATAFVASFVGVVDRLPGVVAAPGCVHVLGRELAAETGDRPRGSPVVVLVRPEDLVIHASGPSSDAGAVGGAVARVHRVVLRGALSSIEVVLADGGAPVRVDVPSSGAGDHCPGDEVRLEARTTRAVLDDAAPAAGPAAAGPAAP